MRHIRAFQRFCESCSVDFIGTKKSRFCCRKCYMRHWNSKNPEKVASAVAANLARPRNLLPLSCERCGIAFVKKQHHQRFCSPRCRIKNESSTLSPEQKKRRKEKSAEWRESDFGRDRSKASHEKRKEKVYAQRKSRRLRDGDKLRAREQERNSARREILSAYVKENRWRWRESSYNARMRRISRKRNAEGKFTFKEFVEVCERYGNICLCCKIELPPHQLTADHVLPLVKGGSNWITNIQPLCLSCNCKKFTKHIDYRPGFGGPKQPGD